MLRLNGGGEEERCGLREAVRIFCGQIVATTALRELGRIFRMTNQIICQALCFQVSLRNDLNIACRKAFAVVANPLTDLRQQQRIVGATQNQGINLRIFF